MPSYSQKLYKRPKKNRGAMNLPSLVDVVFLLITFFLLTTSFSSVLTKLDVQLPSARAVSEQKERDTVIEIAANNQIALNGEFLTLQELDKKLAEISKFNPNEVIIIRGDKEVAYKNVMRIMGFCKSHELNRIAMAAVMDERDEGAADGLEM